MWSSDNYKWMPHSLGCFSFDGKQLKGVISISDTSHKLQILILNPCDLHQITIISKTMVQKDSTLSWFTILAPSNHPPWHDLHSTLQCIVASIQTLYNGLSYPLLHREKRVLFQPGVEEVSHLLHHITCQ